MTPKNETLNEKPAVATIHGELDLVSTTTPRPQQKDMEDELLYHGGTRVNER